jgi:hypothetical protein
MKKLIFGLVAVVFFGVGAKAQQVSKEETRIYAAKIMVEFKSALVPAFNNSKSFEEFIKNSTGPYNPQGRMTTEGYNLLKVAYNYLSSKTNNEKIIASYDGKEIALAFKYLQVNTIIDEGNLFGISLNGTKNIGGKGGPSMSYENLLLNNETEGCKWWQLRCHLQSIFGDDGGDLILDAIIKLIIQFLS